MSRSFIKTSPKIEPWQTTLVTGRQPDVTPFITTLCAWPVNQFFTQCIMDLSSYVVDILSRRTPWETVSKACLKSKETHICWLPLVNEMGDIIIEIKLVKQDFPSWTCDEETELFRTGIQILQESLREQQDFSKQKQKWGLFLPQFCLLLEPAFLPQLPWDTGHPYPILLVLESPVLSDKKQYHPYSLPTPLKALKRSQEENSRRQQTAKVGPCS